MIIYVELIILGLTLIGFWELSMQKDTILWVAFAGFPLLMKSNKINSEQNYLNYIFKDSVKGIVIVEFIANFYSFSLITELILIPVMTLIVLTQAFGSDKPEHNQQSNYWMELFLCLV